MLPAESDLIPDRNDKEISFDTFTKTCPLDYATLRTFCKANKISASALTSAAFALTVGTYTHQQEALFSTIYHGRNDKTKNIVGMFVKTLPVYCRWTGDEKISDLLAEVTEQLQSARAKRFIFLRQLESNLPDEQRTAVRLSRSD